MNAEETELSEEIEENLDAEITVEKSTDDMKATVQMFPATGTGMPATSDMILEALENQGVKFGILVAEINRIIDEEIFYDVVTVAEAQPPIHGQDAQIILHYKENKKHGLQEDQNGKVDFREMNQILLTKTDDLLLEKIPPVSGKPGKTITDKKIPNNKGKDIRVRAGKNVRIDDKGLRFYAEHDGQVIYRNNMIAVENVFTVEEVDAAVGNIHFNGSVHVTKNVTNNYKVEATESVVVGGTIGIAEIKAGGDVIVGGGIIQGDVKSGGMVKCKFAQEAKIAAKGAITAEAYLKNCLAKSNENISVTSEQDDEGFLIGGVSIARKEVSANNVGSEAEVKTEVRVGLDPDDVENLKKLEKEMSSSIEAFSSNKKNLLMIQGMKASGKPLDEKKVELLRKTLHGCRKVRDEMAENIPNLVKLSFSTIIDEKGKVNVNNHTYPNSMIFINSMPYDNKTLKTNCSYVLLDGQVTLINLRRD